MAPPEQCFNDFKPLLYGAGGLAPVFRPRAHVEQARNVLRLNLQAEPGQLQVLVDPHGRLPGPGPKDIYEPVGRWFLHGCSRRLRARPDWRPVQNRPGRVIRSAAQTRDDPAAEFEQWIAQMPLDTARH